MVIGEVARPSHSSCRQEECDGRHSGGEDLSHAYEVSMGSEPCEKSGAEGVNTGRIVFDGVPGCRDGPGGEAGSLDFPTLLKDWRRDSVLVTNVTVEPVFLLWLAPMVVMTPLIVWWNRRIQAGEMPRGTPEGP
jgi:hypothetical protein